MFLLGLGFPRVAGPGLLPVLVGHGFASSIPGPVAWLGDVWLCCVGLSIAISILCRIARRRL